MPGKISLYNLGSLGVDLSKSPFHKDDGSLVSAQNSVPDIRDEAGGLAKRDGLVAINSSALAGTVKGAVFAPLTLGDLGGGTERVYVAITDGSDADSGWSWSADDFVTSTTVTTNPGPTEFSISLATTGAEEGNRAVTVNNKIYYAGNITEGTVPVIRVFDGVTDKEFARVPYNIAVSSTVPPIHIVAMIAVGTTIYFSTVDTVTGDDKSSIYSLSTTTGVITQMGATLSLSSWASSLAWHLGRLWAGFKTSTADTEAVYFFRPGIDTTWTEDEVFTGKTSIEFLIDYEGYLYAGLRATGANTAAIYRRTASDSTWASVHTASGAGASRFISATVFKNKLYVSHQQPTAGDEVSVEQFDGTSWTQVYTTTALVSGIDRPLVFSTKDTLFFFRGIDNDDVVVSTDGTTWSSARALSNGNSHFTIAAIRV